MLNLNEREAIELKGVSLGLTRGETKTYSHDNDIANANSPFLIMGGDMSILLYVSATKRITIPIRKIGLEKTSAPIH